MNNKQLIEIIIVGVAIFVVFWLVIDYIISRRKRARFKEVAADASKRSKVNSQSHATNTSNAFNNKRGNALDSRPTNTKDSHNHKQRTVDLHNLGDQNSSVSHDMNSRTAVGFVPSATVRQQAVRDASQHKMRVEKLPANYNKEDLVVVFVKAHNGNLFSGEQILKLFNRHELKPGNRKIFHKHYPDDKGNYRLAFSVANGIGDGTLSIQSLSSIQTRSLVFIAWTRSFKPLKFFDDMMFVASDCAKALSGRLYAANKEIWTDQTTIRTRGFIREKLAEHKKEQQLKEK